VHFFEIIINGILLGIIYGLMSLGLSVVFGVIRVVNFAHGEIMLLSVYIVLLFNKFFGLNPFISIPLVSVILFAFGYLLHKFFVDKLLKKLEHSQFIAMASFGLILMNLETIIFGAEPQNIYTDYSLSGLHFFGIQIDKIKLISAFLAIITFCTVQFFFHYTKLGLCIRAVSENNFGATVIGLDKKKLYAISFGIGCLCSGIAGALLSMIFDINPQLAPQFTLLSFVIVIMGGLGNFQGVFLAGIIVGLVEELSSYIVISSLKSLFSFIFLIIILALKPKGILSR
jgi:branched-chain amino acid transport system permease protein